MRAGQDVKVISVKQCRSCASEIPVQAVVCRYCRNPSDTPLSTNPVPDPVAASIRSQFTFSISVITLLFIAFQLSRVSGSEGATMLTLLHSAGPGSVVTGVLVSQFPLVLSILMLGGTWWLWERLRLGLNYAPPLALVAALLFIAFFTTPWPFFVVPFVVFGAAVLSAVRNRALGRRSEEARELKRFEGRIAVITLCSIGLLVALLLLRPSVWLPPETLSFSDGTQLVGYVIGEEGSWTTVLTAKGTVAIQRSSDIEGRRVCALEGTSALASSVERPFLRLRMLQAITAVFSGRLPTPATQPCG
ncbi:MAG: hypothetical protein ACRDGU_01460 [Actinomycetota bacterium]